MSIYGDLILEDSATVEFLGDSTIAVVWGSVTRAGNATVTGTFNDYFSKF